MRAAAIEATGTADVLQIMDVDAPLRIDSEVLVKVVAAGVSPLDVFARAGRLPASVLGRFPAVLGYDFSGIVVEAPYGAHPLQPGDEVYGVAAAPRGFGSYAEYVSVPSTHVARKPTRLSHVEAAGAPLAALAAWGMVIDVGKAHEGQIVLVHAGAGGVGHLAVQFAAHFGAHVIATGSARNAAWLRELGAMEVIDYESSPFEDLAVDVDLVIDLVGNARDETSRRSLSVLRHGGLLVTSRADEWPTMAQEAAAAGVRATGFAVAPDGERLAVISRLLESGDVHVYVDKVFDLADAALAHAALEGGHTRGKVVLTVCDG
jgi:NADPH:quinone reductase-like Zn-dependent oxidoreductase